MFLKKYNSLLKQNNSLSLFTMVLLGFIASISGTILIAIINRLIRLDPHNKTFYPNLFAGFMAALGVNLLVQTFYQVALIRVSHKMIWRLRLFTLQNIRQADYLKYLSFGSGRIHAILTRDAYDLSQFSQMLSTVIVSTLTLITGLAYLLWLTPIGCLITLVLAVVMVGMHLLTRSRINRKVNQARKAEDEYNKHFLSVLGGVKELKLDRRKGDELFGNYLDKAGDKAQRMWADVSTRFYLNSVLGNFFFYLVVALFLFILPLMHRSLLSNTFEYILIILYLMGPSQVVINSISGFSYANKALSRFGELRQLEESKEEMKEGVRALPADPTEITFRDVNFHYKNADQGEFSIGPLNFDLQKGEIIFLTGGNGSGKSTFIRLLTGLYAAESGQVRVDGYRVPSLQADEYRSLFASIYTDNYLFDVVLGLDGNQDEEMNRLLQEMGLGSKVECRDHILSTVDLSYGQRKRLSLALTLLEDKPAYVFDELGANQDTEFKEYFYHTVLSGLKSKGKIVFVVTHDEEYCCLADKHYRMEGGKMIRNEKTLLYGQLP